MEKLLSELSQDAEPSNMGSKCAFPIYMTFELSNTLRLFGISQNKNTLEAVWIWRKLMLFFA